MLPEWNLWLIVSGCLWVSCYISGWYLRVRPVSDSQMGFSSSDLIERQAGSVWVEGDEEEAPAWWESGDLLSGRGPGNLTSKSEHRRDLTVVSLHSYLYERRRKNSFLCQMKHDMDIWGKVMWPVEPGVTCICRLKCKLSGFLISMLKVL